MLAKLADPNLRDLHRSPRNQGRASFLEYTQLIILISVGCAGGVITFG